MQETFKYKKIALRSPGCLKFGNDHFNIDSSVTGIPALLSRLQLSLRVLDSNFKLEKVQQAIVIIIRLKFNKYRCFLRTLNTDQRHKKIEYYLKEFYYQINSGKGLVWLKFGKQMNNQQIGL